MAIDLLAIAFGYGAVLALTPHPVDSRAIGHLFITVAISVVGGFWVLRSQGLQRAWTSQVRLFELTRIARSAALLLAVVLVARWGLGIDSSLRTIGVAALASLVALVLGRSSYRMWLTGARRAGRHCRNVLVVGTDDAARHIIQLAATHPEQGTRIFGVVGAARLWGAADTGVPWLGDLSDVEQIVDGIGDGITDVVVSSGSMTPLELNGLVRRLQTRDLDVYLATGLAGIDVRRIRSVPMCHEPLLYVEAPTLAWWQTTTKRGVDIVISLVAVIMTAPIMAVAACFIRIGDGGPVFYRQRRVGRDGREFDVLKLRTMVLDADRRLIDLRDANERQGPLFKMRDDPRVTRIGKFLRESSLDELPQLLNVLRGEMSLVGPRPALPSEVENFSSNVRRRERVMPGITGLWQVEARDNPAFDAYERLDLFYVDNWSLEIDFMIMLATLEHVATKAFSAVMGLRAQHEDSEAVQPLSSRFADTGE